MKTPTTTTQENDEINFTGNKRRKRGNKEQKERMMRSRHPKPKDKGLMDLFKNAHQGVN